MTNLSKMTAGVALVAVALVLVVVGFALHDKAKDNAEHNAGAAAYARAISGREFDAAGPNQVPATVTWVVAGASLLTGVIFLAGSQSTD